MLKKTISLDFKIGGMILMLLFINRSYSQQYSNIIPPSPNAGTLKQFGDYPMDYSTGTVNIAIPIYDIKTKDFSIPIKINFNARGRMGNLNYSPIGVGWALTSTDFITREVRGKPDETANLRMEETKESLLDLGTNPSEYNNNVHDLYEKLILADPEIITYKGHTITYPAGDSENDLFSYSINGQSGKFIVNQAGNVVPLTYTTLRFQSGIIQGGSSTFVIRVMDDRGNEYVFGGKPSAIEQSESRSGNSYIILNSAWFLSEIITASKDTITYNYESVYTGGTSSSIKSRTSIYTMHTYVKRLILIGGGHNPLNGTDGVRDTYSVYHEGAYVVSCLKSIVFPTGKLELFYANANKKLDSIKIFDPSNQGIKTVNFSYMNTPGSGYISNNNSISLADLKIRGSSNATEEMYSFEYYNPTLPFSGANNDLEFVSNVDWWGYCNSYGKFVPPLPGDFDFTAGFYGSKDANELLKLNGMLKKITYPTGGITEFVYENNKCYSIGQDALYGPGLRIAEIKSHDEYGDVLIKKLRYGLSENGKGTLPYLPNPYDFRSQLIYSGYYGSWLSDPTDYIRYKYTSIPTSYASKLYSMPVFYSQVTEYQFDVSDNNLGKTEYYYEAPSLTTVLNEDNLLKHVEVKDWTQSKLLEKKVYKTIPTGYKIIEHTQFTYTDLNYIKIPGVSFIRNHELWLYFDPATDPTPSGDRTGTLDEEMFVRDHSINGIYTIINQPVESAISVKTREQIQTYTDDGNTVSTIKNYEYENLDNVLPTKVSVLSSNGKLNVSQYKYTGDIATVGDIYWDMIFQRNMVSHLIEETDYVDNQVKKVLRTNYFSPYPGVFVPQNVIAKNGINGSFYTLYNFKKYNEKGSILERQEKAGPNEVYIWGYADQYPVAKIETEKTYNEVISESGLNTSILASLSSTEPQKRIELNKLNSLNKSLVTTMTYEPEIGITSISGPSNRLNFFEYDAYGRLNILRDEQSRISKKYEYKYQNIPIGTEPLWSATGNYRCVKDAYGLNSGYQEREDKDLNTTSLSYNQVRWSGIGSNLTACPLSTQPALYPTGNVRCQLGTDGKNTGYQEEELRDLNPNSSTYNQISWQTGLYRTDMCPLPPNTSPNWQPTGNVRCETNNGDNTGYQESELKDVNPLSNTYNQLTWGQATVSNECPVTFTCVPSCPTTTDPMYRCMWGYCQQGLKVYTSYTEISYDSYICFYHYEWSDGYWSDTFYESSTSPCN